MTNSFGNSASSSFGNVARNVTVPVLVVIWLPIAYSAPVAIFRVLSLEYAVTGSVGYDHESSVGHVRAERRLIRLQ